MWMNPKLGKPFCSPPPTKDPRSLCSGIASSRRKTYFAPYLGIHVPCAVSCPTCALLSSLYLSPGLPLQISSTCRFPSSVTSGILQGKAVWEKIKKKKKHFKKKAQCIPTGSWVNWEILQGKKIEVVRKAFSKIKNENKPYRGLEENVWNSTCTDLKALKCLVCLGSRKEASVVTMKWVRRKTVGNFPSSPVAKTPCFYLGGMGFILGQVTKIPTVGCSKK